jgi:hypothetical protein
MTMMAICTCAWSPVSTASIDPPHLVRIDPGCSIHGSCARCAGEGWVTDAADRVIPCPECQDQQTAGDVEERDLDERPYREWCRNPAACRGKGYCPLDPTCGD